MLCFVPYLFLVLALEDIVILRMSLIRLKQQRQRQKRQRRRRRRQRQTPMAHTLINFDKFTGMSQISLHVYILIK